ncbi:MAG: Na/Pi cotransporter family protein [Eubacterium sp.]|nr:Na/Pi cotransporter family protein [Eubacterium sp.]
MSAVEVFLMIASLMGGLAMFLFGMSLMSESLTQITGNGLRNVIEGVTKKKISGYLFGTGITALVQSSSTTTVMVVGFVNAGIMTLFQAVNVILGANLGTTATAWLLSLNAVGEDSLIMTIIKPANLAPFLMVGSVFCIMFSKKDSVKTICNIIIGFSLLMMGMSMMSSAMKPIGEMESFRGLLTSFENPILGYMVAVLFTMVVQSCDATVGIIQALAMSTGVPYAVCVPMICGAQMGTCITSIISSIGGSRNGRRASFLHLFYNLIKTISFMAIFYTINSFIHFPFLSASASLVGIALIHSLINVAYSAILLPMSGVLVKLVNLVLPQTEEEKDIDRIVSALDPVLLKTAPFAIVQAKKVADMIADQLSEVFTDIRNTLGKGQREMWIEINKKCERIILYNEKLTEYTVKIAADSLSEKDSRRLMMVKQASADFMNIIYIYQSIFGSAKRINTDNFKYPKESMQDLAAIYSAMDEVMVIALDGFRNDNPAFVKAIPAFREVISDMQNAVIRKSMHRLHEGEYTYEQHAFVSEMTHSFERIIGCCDDIGRATQNAHFEKRRKKKSSVDNEKQIEIAKQLLQDKFDVINRSA